MTKNIDSYANIFQVGGPLEANAQSYVQRVADDELLNNLLNGQFCYILNSRQTGKSSLLNQTINKLEKIHNSACVHIDLSDTGSSSATKEQWYNALISTLKNTLKLDVNLKEWKHENLNLSAEAYFREFIEKILLTQVQKDIFIFIDEIDDVLRLSFRADDFFILLRSLHNKRSHNPIYKRLSFALFGVATPDDFIHDPQRTPFNIGQAIELKGFQPDEAGPLIEGLRHHKVNYPENVMIEILDWTNGQPFLTQKICEKLVLNHRENIFENSEKKQIEELVLSFIIEDWETKDEPKHLRTIRDRIIPQKNSDDAQNGFYDPAIINRLLLYQRILQNGTVRTTEEDTKAAMDLRLSGLVIEKNQSLKIYNRIYGAIFDQNWVKEKISYHAPPHAEQLIRYIESKNQGFPYLLYGKSWGDFLEWRENKQISRVEEKLYYESRDSNRTIDDFLKHIKSETSTIDTILKWTSGQKFLTEDITQFVAQSLQENSNKDNIQQIIDHKIQERITHNTDATNLNKHFQTIEKYFLVDSGNSLLRAYEKILENQENEVEENEEYKKLQEIGLVVKKLRNLVIANRVYKEYFDRSWIEKIRLYGNKLPRWLSSERQDNSLLLVGQELRDAIEWSKHKLLKAEDCQFLIVSQVWSLREVQMNWHPQDEAGIKILQDFVAEIQESQKTNSPISLITPILSWTDCEPDLTGIICQHIRKSDQIPMDREEQFVNKIVETKILENWETQEGAEHLTNLKDSILSDEKGVRLLKLYKRVIQEDALEDNTSELQETLLQFGLVRKSNERLKPGNPIYEKIFDLNWIETMVKTLKPYTKQFDNWLQSDCKDDNQLLQGQDWKKAEEWAKNQKLSPKENLFLIKSALLDQRRTKNG